MIKRLAKYILRDYLKSLNKQIVCLEYKVQEVQERQVQRATTVVNRLNPSEFARVKAKAFPVMVNGSTTELQAAALVGQQFAFDLIERELVHG